jgi:hypothetical protein
VIKHRIGASIGGKTPSLGGKIPKVGGETPSRVYSFV